jgi:hypothetical protein
VEINDSTRLVSKLLIDTGASHGLLLDPESNDKLMVPLRHINSIIGRGLGGVIMGKIGRIKRIHLGKYKVGHVIANFPDPNSYSDTLRNSKAVFRNGAIGGEILSRFKIIFDFPDEKVYLKKNTTFKKEFHYNLSGLTVKAQGESLRNFEITDVRFNSAAQKADIKAGDWIVSVNDEFTREIDLNRLNDILNSQPGKRVMLEIERNGKRIKREFRLENQI